MVAKDVIQREQKFVDEALDARESRRNDRDSGKYSLAGALATPIKTMAGGRLQKLREIGDSSEDVCFANLQSITAKQTFWYLLGNQKLVLSFIALALRIHLALPENAACFSINLIT